MKDRFRRILNATLVGLGWLTLPLNSVAVVSHSDQDVANAPLKVEATVAGAWGTPSRSMRDPLINTLDLELYRSSQYVALESSYSIPTPRRGSLGLSSSVTQSGILLNSVLPAHDPRDGWAMQMEGSAIQKFELGRRVDLNFGARFGYDTVFKTWEALPAGTLTVTFPTDVRASLQYSEFMSGPWIGSQNGEYRFRRAAASIENSSAGRLRWAGEVSWLDGVRVRSDQYPDPLPFEGDAEYSLHLRFEYRIGPPLSVALGVSGTRGFALRLAGSSQDHSTYTSVNVAVRYDVSWLVRDLRVEAIVHNLDARPIRDFGGAPEHGRSGKVRISYPV